MLRHTSLARFLPFPENQAALAAIQDLLANVRSGKSPRSPNPLFLHGPPGSGKSHLVGALAAECAAQGGLSVLYCVAGDFKEPRWPTLAAKSWPPTKQHLSHQA